MRKKYGGSVPTRHQLRSNPTRTLPVAAGGLGNSGIGICMPFMEAIIEFIDFAAAALAARFFADTDPGSGGSAGVQWLLASMAISMRQRICTAHAVIDVPTVPA